MDLSERIEQLREAKNIRKADMAKALEMDASYYNKFEKRGNKLTIEQLEKIAGVLGVSVIELLTGEGQKVDDNGRVKELEKRVEELEKTINLHEILQETSKNQIHLLSDLMLKCFLYLIYAEELLPAIDNYLRYKNDDIEYKLDIFSSHVESVRKLSTEEIESIILNTRLTGVMMFDINFMLKLLSIGENSRNIFSKKIHDHFRNQYQRYLKILAMQPTPFNFTDD